MNARPSRKRSKTERPSRGRADLARLRHMSETEIEGTSPADLANLPEDFWVCQKTIFYLLEPIRI